MPSPFPGMNPYLELDSVWSDFCTEFCKALKKALVPQLQPHFYVKFNEHIYVHEEEKRLVGLADLGVVRGSPSTFKTGGTALLEAPTRVLVPEIAVKERILFLEIFDKKDHSLVTILELLSPANKKRGRDREQFLAKRREILDSSVNYVEIDLLRAGPRMPMEGIPDCDYYVLVSRATERPEMGLWPIALRDPLPTIPVPLPEPKWEARLPLQELLHQAYDEAGYSTYLYDDTSNLGLTEPDAEWAKQIRLEPSSGSS